MTIKQLSTGKSSKKLPQQVVAAMTEEDRRHMIAEAAYYNAEHRGFQGGNIEEDWCIAEAEIENMLSKKEPGR